MLVKGCFCFGWAREESRGLLFFWLYFSSRVGLEFFVIS